MVDLGSEPVSLSARRSTLRGRRLHGDKGRVASGDAAGSTGAWNLSGMWALTGDQPCPVPPVWRPVPRQTPARTAAPGAEPCVSGAAACTEQGVRHGGVG